MEKPQILLTNDDGILSPGLWAAAAALSELGYVHVVAPRDQYSGAGQSLPSTSDGIIQLREVQVNGQKWEVFSVGGSPAQAVQHAVLELMPEPPALVISGINYGENIGAGITVSGTVGAALEAAVLGIPALAVSLETKVEHHLTYSEEVDFSTAAYFAVYFARRLLERRMPEDVHVLKVDIPASATPATPWETTRLHRLPYFVPIRPQRAALDTPTRVGYRISELYEQAPAGTDVHTLRLKRLVSVTPLSQDLTARTPLLDLDHLLRKDQ